MSDVASDVSQLSSPPLLILTPQPKCILLLIKHLKFSLHIAYSHKGIYSFSLLLDVYADYFLIQYLKKPSKINSMSFFPFAGMATEVRLPSPHRTGNVCPALSPKHALGHCCHAACLWPQCHRDTG